MKPAVDLAGTGAADRVDGCGVILTRLCPGHKARRDSPCYTKAMREHRSTLERIRLLFLLLASWSAELATASGEALAPPGSQGQAWAEPGWLEVSGYRLHYLHRLPPGPRAKGRVLLIHGFGASVYCWSSLAPALVREGYEVVAVDWPPFGWSQGLGTEPSAAQGSGSPEVKARLLWAFLDALDATRDSSPGPWILMGHSLGGRIASWMAVQEPASTQGLVLIAPASLGPLGFPGLGRSRLFSTLLSKNLGPYLSKPGKISAALARAYGRKPSPEEVEAYQAPLIRPGAQVELVAWAGTASESTEPPSADIKAPCLILWGTRDRIVRNQGKRLSSLIPASTYIAYPGAGHVLMETEAARLESDILDFLGTRL